MVMPSPLISQPDEDQESSGDTCSKTDEEPLVRKIKSMSVLNTSCICLSINSVCTCIHLNGNFNKVLIKKVLTMIRRPPLCEPGPSTSSQSSVKKRKLVTSESSDERLKISGSKIECKLMEMDSDDLDSDDLSADESYDPLKSSESKKMKSKQIPENFQFANQKRCTAPSPAPALSLSCSSSSPSLSSIPSPAPSSSSSPVREETEEGNPAQVAESPLRIFFRLLGNAFNNREEDTQLSAEDLRDMMEHMSDDDDDSWIDSLDSDVDIAEDIDTVPNPEVLNKPAPKHTWFPVQEIVQRQYGSRTKYQSASLFQQRYYGSLHAVQRFELMYKMEEHRGCVNALDFHPSGNLLASGSDDRKVVIWDWARGRTLYSYKSGHSSNVFQSKWLHLAGSTGFVVSSARDGMIRLADLEKVCDSTPTTLIAKHKRSAHRLSLMRDTPHVMLSVGEDGRVLSVDIRESATVNSKPFIVMQKGLAYSCMPLYSVASNPLNSNEFIVAGEDTRVQLFDKRYVFTRNAKPLRKFCPNTIRTDVHCYITSAVYNYSGTEILASYNDEKIYLFDATKGTGRQRPNAVVDSCIHCYEGHRNSASVKGVKFFGPRSQYVVSGSDDGYIYIWDRHTEAIVNWMRGDDDGVVNCIEPHPEIPVIATSGLDNNVKIWVPSCEHPPTFKGLKKTILLNEKKRDLIDMIPTHSNLRRLWQGTFDSVLGDDDDDARTDRAEENEDSDADLDDPRQCTSS